MQADFTARMTEMQAKMAALETKGHVDVAKIILEDDRVRDKNDMDFAVNAAKVDLEDKKIKATEAKVAADRADANRALQ
jgi:hypothetical protein